MLLILTWYAFVCVLNRCEKKSNLLSQESLNGFQLIGYFNKTSTLKTNIYSNWEKEIETPIPFAKLTFRFRIGTLERTFRIAQKRKNSIYLHFEYQCIQFVRTRVQRMCLID